MPVTGSATPRGGMTAARRELRERTLGLLHIGRKVPGARLPSVRSLARLLDEDHRAIAEVYRDLQRDGLVEIRPRSGVFVAAGAPAPADLGSSADEWIGEFCAEALHHGIALPELPLLLQRHLSPSAFHCICVESVQDVLTAFCEDFSRYLGIACERYVLPAAPPAESAARADVDALRQRLAGADCVLTTPFHVGRVAPAARALNIPLVQVSVDDEIVDLVRAALRGGSLTVVASDAAFFDRFRAMYADYVYHDDQLRGILARDHAAVAALAAANPVLVTRAARAELGDRPHPPSITQDRRTVSLTSLTALSTHLVLRNLARSRTLPRSA